MSIVDSRYLEQLSYEQSIARIKTDIGTDLIYAPHLSACFLFQPEELFEQLSAEVKSQKFHPNPPYTLEIPKKSGLTRPGSILDPYCRLLYQLLVDQLAEDGESQINRSCVFSQKLLLDDPDGLMFEKASECYSKFLDQIERYSYFFSYVLEADISSFFERIYHHNLINFLDAVCQDRVAVKSLEKLFYAFTQKDSHGIIQGVFPSDFLGNIYLCPLDADLSVKEINFCRYVDDLYLFFDTKNSALKGLKDLCQHLRKEGLNLNESKTAVIKTNRLVLEDKEIKQLFNDAKEEVSSQEWLESEVSYGFTSEWEFTEYLIGQEENTEETHDYKIEAVKHLYESRSNYKSRIDAIDKFCLPILATAECDLAVEDALFGIVEKPHLSREYCKYLSTFAKNDSALLTKLTSLLVSDDLIYDSQLMWILAAMLQTRLEAKASLVDDCLRIVSNRKYSQPVRALATTFVGAHGSVAQRRILKQQYQNEESAYVRAAILYSSKYFPKNERDTCITSWGAESSLNYIVGKTVKSICRNS